MATLATLEELGLRNAFSMVLGSSAGALNGAYFLAGQAREGVEIYCEDLSSRSFVSPWRFWKVVDVDRMIDLTLKQRHPLDQSRMLAAPAPLYTVLTDAETASPKVLCNRDLAADGLDIYEVFRATAALPGLYNRKIPVGDRLFVDGGVADSVPLDEAFQAGAKEAVVILTRGPGHRRTGCGRLARALVRALSLGQSAPVRARVCTEDAAYNSTMEDLDAEERQAPRVTWTLRPSSRERLVGRTTRDRMRLRDCAALARSDTLAFLRQPYLSALAALPAGSLAGQSA